MAGRRTGGRGDARPPVLGGSGQFPLTTGAAPAGRSRKPAPGPRRGSARGYYGASARSWLTVGGPEMGPSAEARPDVVMKTPPTVRREAAALSQSAATIRTGLRLSARRPPSLFRRGDRRLKAGPAPQTIRAMAHVRISASRPRKGGDPYRMAVAMGSRFRGNDPKQAPTCPFTPAWLHQRRFPRHCVAERPGRGERRVVRRQERKNERPPIHLFHAGSDQDLSGQPQGAG